MATEIATRKAENSALLIEHQEKIFNTLPMANKARFMEVSLSMMNSPDLIDCTKPSLFMAIWNCAKMGLVPDPNLGHVWIVGYKNRRNENRKEATVQLGYKGRIELAQRSGRITSVSVHHWWAHDTVEEFEEGINPRLKLKPWWYVGKKEAGPLVATYCIAQYANGERIMTVAPLHEIEASKKRSKQAGYGKGPWIDDYKSMALIVPIRMAHRVWPQSPEMALAATLDRKYEAEEPQSTPQETAEILDGEVLEEGMDGFGFKEKLTDDERGAAS